MSRDGTLARAVRERLERQRKEVVPLGDPVAAGAGADDHILASGSPEDYPQDVLVLKSEAPP